MGNKEKAEEAIGRLVMLETAEALYNNPKIREIARQNSLRMFGVEYFGQDPSELNKKK